MKREPDYTSPAPLVPPITACLNVYQEAKWLERCLRSLLEPYRKVECIVVVDGAYAGFPHECPRSTDGTLEIAERFADIVVSKDTAWENEVIKRNFYVQFVPEGHWWLRIDGDEILKGDFSQFTPEPSDFAFCLNTAPSNGINPYPIHALYRKEATSRYYGTHHAVWFDRTLVPKLEEGRECPLFSGASLPHFRSERDKERVEAKGEYYKNSLQESEREFRGKWRI